MSARDLRSDIKALAHQLEAEDNASYDLWTWLPSYKEAQKYHGDYASDHRPPNDDVMAEAAMRFAELINGSKPTADEQAEWYACPCGEPHEEKAS